MLPEMFSPPERGPTPGASLRSSFAARQRQLSSALSSFGRGARREGQRVVLGARRAAACFAFSSVWVGAWLLGVWSLGSLLVYLETGPGPDAPLAPSTSGAAGAADTRPAGTPAELTLEIERVAGVDREPALPRVPRPYVLDARSRRVGPGIMACPDVELTEHAGEAFAFDPPARVTPPFRERLRELERVLREVSLAFYGRMPSAVLVASAYDCRSISGRSQRSSEHALGNAIDITGFRFDALDAVSAPGFEVRVDRHWNARGDATRELHARFLSAFTQALIARDVFRTLLGPAQRDHADHFHFDMAPHHYVNL